jgi:hypothetical protein
MMRLADVKHADEFGSSNSEQQDENFDWLTDPAVILHDQAAVTAYFNKFGKLVVKQCDTLGAPKAALFIAPENVDAFLQGPSDRARPRKKPRPVNGDDA